MKRHDKVKYQNNYRFVYGIIKRPSGAKVMLTHICFENGKRCVKHPEIDFNEVQLIEK
jgi:hypothetical protein